MTEFKVGKTKFSILNTEYSTFRQTPDTQRFKDGLCKQLNIEKLMLNIEYSKSADFMDRH